MFNTKKNLPLHEFVCKFTKTSSKDKRFGLRVSTTRKLNIIDLSKTIKSFQTKPKILTLDRSAVLKNNEMRILYMLRQLKGVRQYYHLLFSKNKNTRLQYKCNKQLLISSS